MKKIYAILLILFSIIIGNIIYLDHKLDYSPTPTCWGVGSGWGRYYIIEHGKIPKKEKVLTWESGIKNYATVDVMPKILAAEINIVSGVTGFWDSEMLHSLFPWPGLIFLPIVILYFYTYTAKKEREKINFNDVLLLILLSMFPLASTLPSMTFGAIAANAVSRVFFILIIILIIKLFTEKNKKRKWKFFGIITFLLFPFYNYHHTWSYYLLIIGVTVSILMSIKERCSLAGIMVINLIFFFLLSTIFNPQLREEPARLIKRFLGITAALKIVDYNVTVKTINKLSEIFIFKMYAIQRLSSLQGYHSLKSAYSFLQLVNAILILQVCLIFIGLYIGGRRQNKLKPYENVLFFLLIAQFPITIGLFIGFGGIWGIYARIFEPLTYLTMLFAAYLLVKSGRRLKTIIRYVLLSIVILCVISWMVMPHQLNKSLTKEEFVGITFSGEKLQNKSFVFSDFRLGMPLIYFDQLGIKTIDSPHSPPKVTQSILLRCYYNVSHPESSLDKFMNYRNYYVIISSHQSKVNIFDPSGKPFKPAPKDFQKKWSEQDAFHKIYTSKYFDLFQRR